MLVHYFNFLFFWFYNLDAFCDFLWHMIDAMRFISGVIRIEWGSGVGFSAHVAQRLYLSFTTFNFDYTTTTTSTTSTTTTTATTHDTSHVPGGADICHNERQNGQSNRGIVKKIAKICSQTRLLRQQRRNDAWQRESSPKHTERISPHTHMATSSRKHQKIH